MNIYAIPFHSFSDIITNSSTDIFACKTEKTKEEVEDILIALLKTIDPKMSRKKFREQIATTKLTTIKDFYDSGLDYLSGYKYDSVTKDHIVTPYYESAQDFADLIFNGASQDTTIISIEGVEDNSIPYWIQNFISETFNAYRIHCG